MKLFLIITIFVCCVLIGILIKKYYKKRQNFFCDLSSFCENLTNDISYNSEKLDIIIDKNLKLFNSDINQLFCAFKQYINGNLSDDNFKDNLYKNLNFLHEKERIEIAKFFINLGAFAKDEELQKILNFSNLINPVKTDAIEKNKKFSSLYFKLFLFLGIVFVIIFI